LTDRWHMPPVRWAWVTCRFHDDDTKDQSRTGG
jgi:hypothetical protein